MSGLFGTTTIKGTRITDFGSTSATVGNAIPFGYGSFLVSGNCIWAPMPPREHVIKKKQGKGGVKTENYVYTLSYAIAFSKGPIYGILSIRRNGKIVWTQDPNAPVDDLAYAAKWANKATFYYGTPDQLPDSTIEAYQGAGNVSAFRDLVYIVVEDDDVTDQGGAVPSYDAVVIASPPEGYFTSKAQHDGYAADNFGFSTAYPLSFDLEQILEEGSAGMELIGFSEAPVLSFDLRLPDEYLTERVEFASLPTSFDLRPATFDTEEFVFESTVQSIDLRLGTFDTEEFIFNQAIQSIDLGPP